MSQWPILWEGDPAASPRQKLQLSDLLFGGRVLERGKKKGVLSNHVLTHSGTRVRNVHFYANLIARATVLPIFLHNCGES